MRERFEPLAFGIIVIGDEILNGRRKDRHFDALAALLRERGFKVAWLRILPDEPDYLTAELGRSMDEGVPVLCCGGIGATPDDYTRSCAARAAGVPLVMHPGAVAEIEGRFGREAYPNRIRMAELPEGCALIPNPYNRIPGFSLAGHHFMPGFPDMAHPMAAWVLDTYFAAGGPAESQVSVRVRGVTESNLLELMQDLVIAHPQVKLFSLPRLGAEFQVEIGFRGCCDLSEPLAALITGLDQQGVAYEPVDD